MSGSIIRRGEAYSLVVELPRRADGRRRKQWHTVHGTKKEAKRRLAEILREMEGGTCTEPSPMPLAEYLREWLTQTGGTLSARSRERYASIIARHLVPALGEVPLRNLTPLQIQSYYGEALQGGGKGGAALSAATVLKHHHLLRKALGQALRWGMINRNPAASVEPPKAVRSEMRALDRAETARLLAASEGDRLQVPILLAVSSGLRRGELLGLPWRDLDLKSGTLTVRQSLEETAAGCTLKQPKTARSRRSLPLGATTVAALRRHRAAQQEQRSALGAHYCDQDLVFASPDGSPWSPAAFSLAFMRLVRRIGLGGTRLHDLRHTHASLLLAQGVHPKIVSERLGHASVAITLDTYSHVLPGLQEAAVAQFDAGLATALEDCARGSAVL